MKVYVSELPENCKRCPCNDDFYCNLYWEIKEECLEIYENDKGRHNKCPLQSLSDYTKQVRKEVCEEIKDSSELFGVCKTGIIKEEYRIDKDILDQIQD